MSSFRKILLLLPVVAVIWSALLLFAPSTRQDQVFFGATTGKYGFDYFNARTVASMPHPYSEIGSNIHVGAVELQDQCYPALTYILLSALPDSYAGVIICQSASAVVFLVGLMLFFRKYGVPPSLPALTLLVSWRMLRSLELGNTIVLAVGAVFVFLAWYDSDSRLRRLIAALSLAFATALKITPALLGLVYLLPGRKADWRGAIVSGTAAAALLLIPFAFFGGLDGFSAWLLNAADNSGQYAWRNGFGWYGLVSELFRVLGYDHRIIHLPLRILSSLFALLLIVRAFWVRGDAFARICLIVLGMLFLPPTMMSYTLLYVVPLFIVGTWRYAGKPSRTFAICWVVCCVPLQIPLLFGSLNGCLVAAATLDICFVVWKLAAQSSRNALGL